MLMSINETMAGLSFSSDNNSYAVSTTSNPRLRLCAGVRREECDVRTVVVGEVKPRIYGGSRCTGRAAGEVIRRVALEIVAKKSTIK
jgi:hypothetical protein